jgi:ureidoacrylate peracid hydrolase
MAQQRDHAMSLAHCRVLNSLEDKIDPAHSALIVVDMQNDFCAPGGVIANEGQDISDTVEVAERLPSFIHTARAAGVLIVFVRTIYTTESNFYLSDSLLEHAARRRPDRHIRTPFCLAGSWGGDFYRNIQPRSDEPLVTKHRYSGFYNTELDTILRTHRIRTLVLTGVATNVCVATTAHDGFMRDYYIVILKDGTASYARDQHEMALADIDRFYGEVANIGQITRIWEKQTAKQANRA